MSANLAEKFTAYPVLSEMGISRFHEISHYSLQCDGESKDILRVNYTRARGSLLPSSRKYKFGRSYKTIVANGGTSRMESIYEISPFLLNAMSELDALVDGNQLAASGPAKFADTKKVVLAEINELAQQIRDAQCDNKAVVAKLVSLRMHIESL